LAIEFDCYLIDEVILVGDNNFQRKCHEELFEKRADRAMIIASHDMNIVREVCNRGIVIHEGKALPYEDLHEAAAFYEEL
jgi:capsular polysaccharide transport system ATP-binding protein